jgi:hypothetical protein
LAWAVSFQILISILYLNEGFKINIERKRFGYFPDDWEKYEPTSRFVVEEARDIPFLSNEVLKKELISRNITPPKSFGYLDRKRAERILEQVREVKKM